jgi:hypothetical protein
MKNKQEPPSDKQLKRLSALIYGDMLVRCIFAGVKRKEIINIVDGMMHEFAPKKRGGKKQ